MSSFNGGPGGSRTLELRHVKAEVSLNFPKGFSERLAGGAGI